MASGHFGSAAHPQYRERGRYAAGRANDRGQSLVHNVREISALAAEIPSVALRAIAEGIGLDRLPRPSIARASACRIPQCQCPSADLGEIYKEADRPEVVQLSFRMRNNGQSHRTYALSAQPAVAALGGAGGPVLVTPASVALEPGEVATIVVTVDASAHEDGAEYTSAVAISADGAAARFMQVGVLIRRKPDYAPIIDMHHGCGPRPLRWYHHFYCEPPKGRRVDGPATAASPAAPAQPDSYPGKV
jgi:hypothetical protein